MDTPLEIRRDEWIQDHIGCCGTCDHHNGLGYCENEDSRYCGMYMYSEDGCQDYLERDHAEALSRQMKRLWEQLQKGM